MTKKVTKKELKYIKQLQNRIDINLTNLRESYIEICKDEYFRTGMYNTISFKDFLVIHMNYTLEEANEIIQNYETYDKKFSRKIVETMA